MATPWLLLLYLFDITLCLVPSLRPDKEWSLNQAVRMRTVRLVLLYWSRTRWGDRLRLEPGRERDRFEIIHPSPSKLYRAPLDDPFIRPATIGGTWTPARPNTEKLGAGTTFVLHFHGGGFVIGDGRDHDTGLLAQCLLRNLKCDFVFTPQYRLSSSKGGEFPAPIQDALTSYLHLIRDLSIPADQIILSGDSAGGNMVLGLMRYISDYGKELNIPSPRALTLWSPWVAVDSALTQDILLSPNHLSDYINAEFGRWGAIAVSGSGLIDTTGPYLSPLKHPFTLDPSIPVFVHAGEREVLLHDISEFSRCFRTHGWSLSYHVSKGCPHDILLLGSRIGFARQAQEAVKHANNFLSKLTLPQTPVARFKEDVTN
ncbi:hypothetical protein PFICI_12723 [Pestalotiopsis fici W106-1]|uniref:Alpha/beta hydrolase fold-3 domain-containing protein n=1 Tax=Pestalotiopsis fici (strain W106-1 / CGMCC3.15140) TaxID=1229662 RepID=W3WPR6_PESFW|nr:uncharacterized protein PFICI_12723 [Pestalotiopsis fici W106-1]ETS75779.1 hypothetical protein PFICI_12723 [Pestalotiopsis fici W106-1]